MAAEGDDKSVKLEVEVKREPVECVVCGDRGTHTADVTSSTTTSGTALLSFFHRYTQQDLSTASSKYICKSCHDLINVLEQAELEYLKLKETFEAIISKNPLFHTQAQNPQPVGLVKVEIDEYNDDNACDNNESDEEPLAIVKKKRPKKAVKSKKKVVSPNKRRGRPRNSDKWSCDKCGERGIGGAEQAAAHMWTTHTEMITDLPPVPELKKENSVDGGVEEHIVSDSDCTQENGRETDSMQINAAIGPQPQLGSNCQSKSDVQGNEVPQKKRKLAWFLVKKFENVTLAQEALNNENSWSINYSNDSEEGKKTYYRCNKVKKRAKQQCSAKRYLLYDINSDAVFLYQTSADHDHENKDLHSFGLPEAVKSEIDKLSTHLKPIAIITALHKMDGIQVPTMSQLRNYLNYRRRASCVNDTISLGELGQWLRDNWVLPVNSTDAFVISFHISESNPAFQFVLSSKYLLELASDADVLHADATCKLTWQGYPVFIVGTTDKNGKFHALCLAVSTTEEKDDFQLIFKSMKDIILSTFSRCFKPKVLIAAGTEGIHNAFTEEFEGATVRMCWTYVRRELKSRIERDVKGTIQKQMLEDVDTLHAITNQYAFITATELFLLKYAAESNFLKYFKDQWLVKNRNWYLGSGPVAPSTNNALEAFSKVVKDSNTLRERLQLSRFLEWSKKIVNEWSVKYFKNSQENFIAKSPEITIKHWTDAYNWSKQPKDITITQRDEEITCFKVSDGHNDQSNVFVNPPENLDEFKEQFFSNWEVRLSNNREEWMQGTCTCPIFFEKYMCKHVIGMSISLEYTDVPAETKVLRKKRGRPSKADPSQQIP